MNFFKNNNSFGKVFFLLGVMLLQAASAVDFEAENLTRTASAVGSQVATNQSGASNNAFVYLNETAAVNDWMEFTLPNLTAGTYTIKIYYKTNSNRAIFQGKIDGTNQAGTCDQYASSQVNQVLFDMGNKTLTAGNHQLRMTVTGKNGSSSGYVLTLDKITLTVTVPPPTITTQPQSQTINIGSTATFTIAATGSGTLTYQWRRNGTNISGATSTSHTTQPVTQADNGVQFSCAVTNAGGSTISSNATLTVNSNQPPTITVQPTNLTVTEGQTATFSITATGSGTLTYQWRRNGVTISGATSASYTTPATTLADSGVQFSCVVTNAYGSATSTNALLIVQTSPRKRDSLALVAIYNSTGGPSWTINTNWLTNQPIDTWHGVVINSGRVYQLTLDNNNLTGSLPPEIGNLSGIQTLQISNNPLLSGPIPREVGNMTNVNLIIFRNINLNGTIPQEIQNLNLTALVLSSCQLSDTLPSWLGNFSNLQVLDLSSNRFTGRLPSSLGNQTGLRGINVNMNQLTGSIPSTFGNLTNLVELQLANNQLTGQIPPELGNARSLVILRLQYNQLSGAIPMQLGRLAQLTTFEIHYNSFTVLPDSIVRLTNVTSCVLDYNQFCNLAPAVKTWANAHAPTWASTQTCPKPDVTVSASPLSGAIPLAVTFTATNAGQSSIDTWSWNFGDGGTASTQNTSHTYTSGGTFIAQLIASGIGGRDTATVSIQAVAPPTITTQPSNQSVLVGQTATFSIVASGVNLSYQWRKNGTNISGATSASYTTPAASQADNGALFSCVVSNIAGSVTSSNATLTVTTAAAPIITSEPANMWVNDGQAAVFSVSASGSTPLTYQWRKGTALVGSNSPTYSIAAARATDAGTYWVTVGNSYGADTSTKALLTVLPSGVKFNNQKLSVNGDLRDANGNPVGNVRPDTIDMTVRVMNRDTGGVALCVERFLKANSQGVIVDKGFFSARLGEGTTTDNLTQVLASNPHLWVQIIIEGATPDTLRPRTPLTANGQAMVSGGAQPLHGNGAPAAGLNAIVGTYYINDADGTTWVRLNSGWRQMQ